MTAIAEMRNIEKLLDEAVINRQRDDETFETAYDRVLREEPAMQKAYDLYTRKQDEARSQYHQHASGQTEKATISGPDRNAMEVHAKIKQVVAEMDAVTEAASQPGESHAQTFTRLITERNKKIEGLMRRHDQLLIDLPL